MKKQVVSIILACGVFMGCLSGCGGKTSGNTGGGVANDGKVSDKPIELTIFQYEKKPFDNDFPVFKKAAEMTNVSLKSVLSKSTSDKAQAFNLMMASGEIADIVAFNSREDYFKYGKQGAFAPLNELIEKYAPNIKKYFDENPDVRKFATATDGNIYFIPFTPDGIVAQGWFVRKDWLDTLGLKEPTSVDEYYNVLKAFRNGDPNGNGKADEIPYFNRNASAGWEESVSSLYIFWDAYKSWHVRDGKIVYGPTEPQYKTAIENISKWYSEKLIDPEIYTRGNKARDILLADNTGGSTHDWFGSTAQLNDTLKDKNPGLNFVAMAPPSGVEGTRRAKVQADGWGISSQCKNLEEAIKYFDFWFTEDGRRLMNFGIEGEEYDMVDGKPKFRESVVKGEKPALDILQGIGAQMFLGYHQDFEYEKQWLNPIALKGIEEYTEKNYPAEQFPVLNFTDEEEKEIKNIMGAIDTYRDEMTQKWVLGGENLNDGFGKFNETIQQMKIEKATSIMQAAYDRDIKK